MNLFPALIVAYFATGIALTGFDFAAPPLKRKMYTMQKNYRMAVLIWFIWPITSLREVITNARFGNSASRLAIGIAFLFLAMVLAGSYMYGAIENLVENEIARTIVTFVILVAVGPIMSAWLLPSHE